MKVTLDLDALQKQGRISAAEAERLKGFAAADTGTLGTNILLAFGIVAVTCGAGVLLPTPETAIVVGALLLALGLSLSIGRVTRWLVLAEIVTVIGTLALAAGVWAVLGDSLWVKLGLSIGLAVAAVAARSGLLAGLSVFMFAAALVTGTDYFEPTHYLLTTIGVLCALILALYLVSLRLAPDYERLAIIAMRTAILMVNGAFFIGSLFGDDTLGLTGWEFSIAWAVALVAFGAWAVFANRRWVVNSVAVFGALHFFTQWFMVLGAQPLSILGAGLLLIGFGLALARFNNVLGERRRAVAL